MAGRDGACTAPGSRKENHADFARAAAGNGFVALTFDNRGHGETEGDLGPDGDRRPAAAGGVARRAARRRRAPGRRARLEHGRPDGDPRRAPPATASPRWSRSAPRPSRCWPRTCGASPTGGRPPRGSALAEMRIDAPALADWLETQRRRRRGAADGREAAADHPCARRRGGALHALREALRAGRRAEEAAAAGGRRPPLRPARRRSCRASRCAGSRGRCSADRWRPCSRRTR